MKIVHTDNLRGLTEGVNKGMFKEDVARLRDTVTFLISEGDTKQMALQATDEINDSFRNMGVLRGLIAKLLSHPYILEVMAGKDDAYIRKVFLSLFEEIDLEPDPKGEATRRIRSVK